MKILKFNEKLDVNQSLYFVSQTNDKTPWERKNFNSFFDAYERMIKLNEVTDYTYIIFEGNFKELTEDDIKIHLNSKKYNI